MSIQITNGSAKQIKWATDIINGFFSQINGVIDVEEKCHHDATPYRTLRERFAKWLEAGAQTMGGSLAAGWVINNRYALANALNEMQRDELKQAGRLGGYHFKA